MANQREGFRRVSQVASWVLCAPLIGLSLLWAVETYFNLYDRFQETLLWSIGFFLAAPVAFLVPRALYRVGIYLADGFGTKE